MSDSFGFTGVASTSHPVIPALAPVVSILILLLLHYRFYNHPGIIFIACSISCRGPQCTRSVRDTDHRDIAGGHQLYRGAHQSFNC